MFLRKPALVLSFALCPAVMAPAQQPKAVAQPRPLVIPDLPGRMLPPSPAAGVVSGNKEPPFSLSQPGYPRNGVPGSPQPELGTPENSRVPSGAPGPAATAGTAAHLPPLLSSGSPAQVKVPPVEGKSRDAATSLLAADHLQAIFHGDRGGVATQQDPIAGRWVNPGSTVTVTLAFPRVLVPSVYGLSAEEAQSRLRLFLLEVGAESGDSGSGSTVASQSPFAGTEVARGTPIALTFRAPTPAVNPGVVPPAGGAGGTPTAPQGTGEVPPRIAVPPLLKKSGGEAETALKIVDLTLGRISGPPNGVVASQDPLAGTMVDAGSAVSISLRLETVSVPNVMEDPQSDAIRRLSVFQLQPRFRKDSKWDPGLAHVVVSQTPAAGTEVDIGSTVAMVLGNATVPLSWWQQVPGWLWVGAVGMLGGVAIWKWKPFRPAQPTPAAWTVASGQRSAKVRLGQNGDPKVQWTFGLRDQVPAAQYRYDHEPVMRRGG